MLPASHYVCCECCFWHCLFVEIERQISVRSSRDELVKRGILQDVDADEGNQSTATTGQDSKVTLGESIFFICF